MDTGRFEICCHPSRRALRALLRMRSANNSLPHPEVRAKRASKDGHRQINNTKGNPMPLDTAAAVSRLMRFLAIEGVTGREAAIGREIASALKEAGVPGNAIY